MTDLTGWTLPCGAKVVRCEPYPNGLLDVDFNRRPLSREGIPGQQYGRLFTPEGRHRWGCLPDLIPPKPQVSGVDLATWLDATAYAIVVPAERYTAEIERLEKAEAEVKRLRGQLEFEQNRATGLQRELDTEREEKRQQAKYNAQVRHELRRNINHLANRNHDLECQRNEANRKLREAQNATSRTTAAEIELRIADLEAKLKAKRDRRWSVSYGWELPPSSSTSGA